MPFFLWERLSAAKIAQMMGEVMLFFVPSCETRFSGQGRGVSPPDGAWFFVQALKMQALQTGAPRGEPLQLAD